MSSQSLIPFTPRRSPPAPSRVRRRAHLAPRLLGGRRCYPGCDLCRCPTVTLGRRLRTQIRHSRPPKVTKLKSGRMQGYAHSHGLEAAPTAAQAFPVTAKLGHSRPPTSSARRPAEADPAPHALSEAQNPNVPSGYCRKFKARRHATTASAAPPPRIPPPRGPAASSK